jgi:4-amino-4-deoxy-L-arabinose transferase-like glycosyltransferase
MVPETSPDGATYHLGLVSRYLRAHGFERITTSMFAALSQGIEMLFLFAFAFGRHSAAALVHFAFLAALPLAMLSYARRFGFPVAGVCGSLLVFASPAVGLDGTTAYNDVAAACIVFTVFYLAQIWAAEEANRALLVPLGLAAGFAYAAKYTAFPAVPYALAVVGWKSIRRGEPVLKAAGDSRGMRRAHDRAMDGQECRLAG